MSEKVLDIDSKTSEPWREIRDLRTHLQDRIVGQKGAHGPFDRGPDRRWTPSG